MHLHRSILTVALLLAAGTTLSAADAKPTMRNFTFTYAGEVTGLKPGQTARVWLPVPPSNDDQTVKLVSKDLPAKEEMGVEKVYGNKVLFFEAKANDQGTIPFSVKYQVSRREVKGNVKGDENTARFLEPDAKVPIAGKPLELIKDKKLPEDKLETARVLYDVVNGHMRYSKEGTGWGRGDSVWACDSKYGNCSDFHSLFISLARSQKIPAKFEIGFSIPEKHGSGEVPGYHCWAKFKTEKGWVPVDISEANKNPKMREYYFGALTPDRVAFSVGRDLDLVPRQQGEPLNFFVFPYVEVDGKAHDQVKRAMAFQDVE